LLFGCSKNYLESTLNFESAPLKLQRAIKGKKKEGGEGRGERERMERGGGQVSLGQPVKRK